MRAFACCKLSLMIACVRVLYQDMGEYDPVRPGVLDIGLANVTAMPVAFNKDLARALGGRQDARARAGA